MGVPGFLRARLEKAGGGYNEYVVLRTQLGTVALFVFSVFLLFSRSLELFALLFGVVLLLFSLNVYSVFKLLKGIRNPAACQYFFGGLNLFGLAMALSNIVVQGFNPVFALSFLVALGLFLLFFQVKFRKNHAFGEVLLADKDWAVVKIPYDLCSGTRNGFYAVRSRKGVKRGDDVKVEISHSIGERRMPWRITE
jgi:uncharacterized membrane protein